ncbi:MAG: PBP1A family penicillin-binding protein [Bdellovibrionota bacterium]
MLRKRLKTILLVFTTVLTLMIIVLLLLFFSFDKELSEKLEAKKYILPTEYFAAPLSFKSKMLYSREAIEELLVKRNYRSRNVHQRLLPGDYLIGSAEECATRMQAEIPEITSGCLGFSRKSEGSSKLETPTDETSDKNVQWILFNENKNILNVYLGIPAHPGVQVSLDAPLLAQYIGNSPVMQEAVNISQIPPSCLNAVMAIEDNQFLEHGGFSFTGLARALFKNITGGKKQGGSTITQQLVKNYFLSSEQTYRRKINELFLAILLESKFSKDQILEMYVNIIYMGQSGVFQVIGFPASAQYYFQKNISELQLSECATLAAVLNGPGVYDPFRKPEKSLARRNLVLEKMKTLKLISESEYNSALKDPLPIKPAAKAAETAPYFIDAARKQLQELSISIEGAKIYTSLDLEAQQEAQQALQSHLNNLEKTNKYLKEKKEKGQTLEGVVLSGDPETGLVSVAVGGRSFKMTQFNRAVDSHRQVGSIMKPFVYLTALSQMENENKAYTPISLLDDTKFQVSYEGQHWSPENYGKKYYGTVPLFYALKNSLNASTASLGLKIGLDKIILTANAFGLQSEMKALPSLVLGSFEMYPKEVLQAYMTIGNFGQKPKLSFIRKVMDSDGKVVFENFPELTQAYDPVDTAVLLGMMKQTLLTGTARSVSLSGFTQPAAGKTGTTNDNKDAWFVGFTPFITTLVWVGYDNNLPTKLTGGSGAAPIWTQFMKKVSTIYPPEDFSWPENTVKVTLSPENLQKIGAEKEAEDNSPVELIFKKGSEPRF